MPRRRSVVSYREVSDIDDDDNDGPTSGKASPLDHNNDDGKGGDENDDDFAAIMSSSRLSTKNRRKRARYIEEGGVVRIKYSGESMEGDEGGSTGKSGDEEKVEKEGSEKGMGNVGGGEGGDDDDEVVADRVEHGDGDEGGEVVGVVGEKDGAESDGSGYDEGIVEMEGGGEIADGKDTMDEDTIEPIDVVQNNADVEEDKASRSTRKRKRSVRVEEDSDWEARLDDETASAAADSDSEFELSSMKKPKKSPKKAKTKKTNKAATTKRKNTKSKVPKRTSKSLSVSNARSLTMSKSSCAGGKALGTRVRSSTFVQKPGSANNSSKSDNNGHAKMSRMHVRVGLSKFAKVKPLHAYLHRNQG